MVDAPPLRERRVDLVVLAEHFVRQLSAEMGMPVPRFSAAAREAVAAYDYPGNVRELRNLVERALLESGGEIQSEHLHFVFPLGSPAGSGTPSPEVPRRAHGLAASAPAEDQRILAFVREQGSINNAQCRELLGVGMHRAWYLLRRLHRAGALRQDSSGRWAHYRLP